MFSKQKIWDKFEYLLGVLAVVVMLLYVYIGMHAELHDPDIWVHLKTGEYIVNNKTLPNTDIFSSTAYGKEWIDNTWLVKVIFYLVFRFGGTDSLISLSALLVTFAFLFLFLSASEQRQKTAVIAGMLLITIFASTARFNIRPENFSLLFFSIYLLILTRHIRSKWVFLLPLLQIFWVNCHVLFVLGPFLLFVFILAEALKRNRLLPWEWSKVEPLDQQTYRNLLTVFFLTCLASFLNPYGYKGVLCPLGVSFSATGKSSIFYGYIQELMPVWKIQHKSFVTYYILIVLSSFSFILRVKKINIAHFIAWAILLIVSLRINRFLVFFNFIAFLAATQILTKGQPKNGMHFSLIENLLGKRCAFFRNIVLILIIFYVSKEASAILNSKYYIFDEYRIKSSLLGVNAEEYPKKAADFMLNNKVPGNVFNLFNDGSYLIYRLSPENKVFIDGRTELYGGDFFEDYVKITNVNQNTIEASFIKYNINTVFLSEPFADTRGLTKCFYDSPNWTLIYFNIDALIFLKNSPRNQTLINKLKVNLAEWQPPKPEINKIGLIRILPKHYLKRAWTFYYLGLDEQALAEAMQAIRILPSNTDAYNIIARLYLKRRLYDLAFENLRIAYIYNSLNKETLISLGSFYMQTDRAADAIDTYKKLIKIYPSFSKAYYFLSHAYSKMNNLKLAITSLEKAIAINPYKPKYYQELAGLFYQDKRPLEASRIYQKAVSLNLDTRDFYESQNK